MLAPSITREKTRDMEDNAMRREPARRRRDAELTERTPGGREQAQRERRAEIGKLTRVRRAVDPYPAGPQRPLRVPLIVDRAFGELAGQHGLDARPAGDGGDGG